ncbi:hypothetical protein [Bacillus cereus]|nr:hypothetical protein [Bacillus cereus]
MEPKLMFIISGHKRPIGAGKTTLFLIIASSFSPTEGLTLLIDFVT